MKSNVKYQAVNEEHGSSFIKDDGKWRWIWQGTNAVMTLFFTLAAYVNVNDEDFYIWVPVYLLPGFLSLAIAVKPEVTANSIWKTVATVHITLCLAGGLYLTIIVIELLTGAIVNPLQHEEGRELGGTVIIVLWLSLCRFTSIGGGGDNSKGAMNTLLLMTGITALLPLVVWGLCFVDPLHKQLGHCKDMF
ncbi:unnamed protein product [Owenia fusiformis]|uniref:Uncharacterized protein n=1 Tax=Owenia fusiformis TaxID=6347 RepID=A0A8J1UJH9_OWEFU|nr:unnamed protein product [Owenia fusiformis]